MVANEVIAGEHGGISGLGGVLSWSVLLGLTGLVLVTDSWTLALAIVGSRSA